MEWKWLFCNLIFLSPHFDVARLFTSLIYSCCGMLKENSSPLCVYIFLIFTDDSLLFFTHKTEYVCHGSWMENGTTFIIARHAGTKHGVCISFRPSSTDSTAAQLIIGDSCYRETMLSEIPEHHLISNVSGIVRKYRITFHFSTPAPLSVELKLWCLP